MHAEVSEAWADRCRGQILATLAMLEADRADRRGGYWFGATIGHADIAVAVALRFLNDVHPDLMAVAAIPALRAHAARLESLPVFQRISQPFVPPA